MRLLLTGAWRSAEKYILLLRRSGHEVVFMQNESDTLPCSPEWAEGVICNGLFLYHSIRAFEQLRYIQLTSAGFDRVDMEYIKTRGITIHNARGVYSIPMAEHAVAAVLNLYRSFPRFVKNQERHLWKKERSLQELYGSTVCVIGCGSVGEECAKRFSAFGCRITGIDLVTSPKAYFDVIYPIAQMREAISAADVVILTLPLTKQTVGMVNGAFLAALKDGCVLVNIARGKLIDSSALIAELRDRRIYAALDVFEEEPLSSESSLWRQDNVLITPHNSFVGSGTEERLNSLIMENLTNGQRRYQKVNG